MLIVVLVVVFIVLTYFSSPTMRIFLPSRSPSPSAPPSPTTPLAKRLPHSHSRSGRQPRPRATSNRYGLRDNEETSEESNDEDNTNNNSRGDIFGSSGKGSEKDWDFDCTPVPPARYVMSLCDIALLLLVRSVRQRLTLGAS